MDFGSFLRNRQGPQAMNNHGQDQDGNYDSYEQFPMMNNQGRNPGPPFQPNNNPRNNFMGNNPNGNQGFFPRSEESYRPFPNVQAHGMGNREKQLRPMLFDQNRQFQEAGNMEDPSCYNQPRNSMIGPMRPEPFPERGPVRNEPQFFGNKNPLGVIPDGSGKGAKSSASTWSQPPAVLETAKPEPDGDIPKIKLVEQAKQSKATVLRTEEDRKKLEEFDVMQAQVNWAHFSITKKMLKEAYSDGIGGKDDIINKKNFDVTNLEFYCKLCDVQTASAGNFSSHLNGKKHKIRVEKEVDQSKLVIPDDNEAVKEEGIFDETDDERNDDNCEYEANYFEEFNIFETNVDWEEYGITETMLQEASMSNNFIPQEERHHDIYKLQYYCKLCDVQTPGPGNFYDHLVCKKHQNKVALYAPKSEEAVLEREEEKVRDLGKEAHDRQIYEEFDIFKVDIQWETFNITKLMLLEASFERILMVNQPMKKKDFDVKKLEFFCKLCSSQNAAIGNFQSHLTGKRHRTAVQDHMKSLRGVEMSTRSLLNNIGEVGKMSILKRRMIHYSRDFVGLTYMTEWHSIYQIWVSCRLCGCRLSGKTVFTHPNSYRHKVLYLKDKYPEAYREMSEAYEKDITIFGTLNAAIKRAAREDGPGQTRIVRYDEALEGDPCLAWREVPFDDKPEHRAHYQAIQRFLVWVHKESEDDSTALLRRYKDRPLSPILSLKNVYKDDKDDECEEFLRESETPRPKMGSSTKEEQKQKEKEKEKGPNERPRDMGSLPPRPKPRASIERGEPFPPVDNYPEPFPPRVHPDHRRHHDYLRHPDHHMPPDLRLLPDHRMPPHPSMHPDLELPGLYRERFPPHPRMELMPLPPALDPDPRNRVLPVSREPYLDPDPLKRLRPVKTEEGFIDPDPLKRVLPSQKPKAVKPVVIDYGHGKEEKSEKTKAKEWEDDMNDLFGGAGSKSRDSLSLLSSSYSSPKRERSPSESKPTKNLPFDRSYLDRAKEMQAKRNKADGGRYSRGIDREYERKHISPPNTRDYGKRYPPSVHDRDMTKDYPIGSASKSSQKREGKYYGSKRDRSNSPSNRISTSKKYRSRSPESRRRKSRRSSSYSSNSNSSISRSSDDSRSPPRKSKAFSKAKGPDYSGSPPRKSMAYSKAKDPNYYGSPPRKSNAYSKAKSPVPFSRKSNSLLKFSRIPSSSHQLEIKPTKRSSSPIVIISPETSPVRKPSAMTVNQSERRPKASSSRSPLLIENSPPRVRKEPLPQSSCAPPPQPESLPGLDELLDSVLHETKSAAGSRRAKPPMEAKKPSPITHKREDQSEDDDAQADMIANMLLSMKNSIIGGDIADPHAALQALLSSSDVAEALLSVKSQKPETSAGKRSDDESSKRAMDRHNQQTRDKIAFSVQALASATKKTPIQVLQTFMEEDSEEEEEGGK